MDDCLFCRIVAGELPATIVARTDSTVAFRDINPVSPTHVLVIPTRHVATLEEAMALDPVIVADVVAAAARVADDEGLSEGWRLVVNTGRHGGQEVHHLHVHVLGGRQHTWPPG